MKKQVRGTPTYIFSSNDDTAKYSTKRWLIKLFSDYPSRTYRSHDDIKEALMAKYQIDRTQSAISKGLKDLLGHAFIVRNSQYIVTSFKGSYVIQNEAEFSRNLREKMNSEFLFARNSVYYQHNINCPQIFVFWINDSEPKKEQAKKYFEQLLLNDISDIFFIENRLIIMLDPDSSKCNLFSDVLKNFFSPYYDAYKRIN